MPTPDHMARAKDRNMLTGKGQPSGRLKLDAYEQNGWWGATLKGNLELLQHPLTEMQVFRFYFLGRVHVEAALQAAGGMLEDSDVLMLED